MRAIPAAAAAWLSAAIAAAPLGASSPPPPTPTPDHHERAPQDTFRLKPLGGNVYALFGRGGNVGFYAGPDAVYVIDSQFKDMAAGIVEQIRSVSNKSIRVLINTHHHGDHVGGNDLFRPFATIVAQDNVRARMLASPQAILQEYPARLEEARKAGNADMAKVLEEQIAWAKNVKVEEIAAPTMTYDSELRIYPGGGETIQIWHLPPAHTDGDSVVYFEKANVLHMGDAFFNGVIPFIDVSGGGSPRGYLAALDKVIARVPADVVIIPGHGEVTTLSALKTFRQYIADLVDAARKARAAGIPKGEFLEKVDLPAYKDWRGYSDRFKGNAAAAYDESP